MAGTRSLTVKIVGDSSSLEKAFGRASSSGKKYQQDINLVAKAHDSFARSAAFAATSILGGAGVVSALHASIDAATKSQEVQRRSQQQLEALGISYQQHAKHIDDVIQKQSQLAALDDEDLTNSFTSLVRVTKDVNQALELNAIAADVARGKNVSLDAATQIVTKASLGQLGALKRMGVEIPPVTAAVDALKASHDKATAAQLAAAKAADQQATRQQALALLQKQFAGQAEAYGKTSAGAQERLKVATENLQETIGAALLPTVEKTANAVSGWLGKTENLQKVQNGVNKVVDTASKVIGDLWPKIKNAAQYADDLAQKVGGWDKAFEIVMGGVLANKIIGLTASLGGRGLAGALGGATSNAGRLEAVLTRLSRGTWAVAVVIGIEEMINKKAFQQKVDAAADRAHDWVLKSIDPFGVIKSTGIDKYRAVYPSILTASDSELAKVYGTTEPSTTLPSNWHYPKTTGSAQAQIAVTSTRQGTARNTSSAGGGGGGSRRKLDIEVIPAGVKDLRSSVSSAIQRNRMDALFAFDVRNANNQWGPLSGYNTDSITADKERAAAAAEAVKQRVQAMAQAVDAQRSLFSASFARLGDSAQKAISAKYQKMQADIAGALRRQLAEIDKAREELTPAEQQLTDLQVQHDEQARHDALTAAQQTGDAKQIAEAQYAIQVAALQKQAQAERKVRDADAAAKAQAAQEAYDTRKTQLDQEEQAEKDSYAAKLSALDTYLSTRALSVQKANDAISADLGEFAAQLDSQIQDVVAKLGQVRAAGGSAPNTAAALAAAFPGWHPMADGGDFMVNGPTLFLAGEAGPERATFSPMGGRNYHGTGTVTVVSPIILDGQEIGRAVRKHMIRDSISGASTNVIARSRTGV